MIHVNYYLISKILHLLERVEMIDGIEFEKLNADDADDVRMIAEKIVKPYILELDPSLQQRIQTSIEFYSATKSAPFQRLRDGCQELSLPDANDWPLFYFRVGTFVFGKLNSESPLSCCIETLDESESW
jgi:hypothetical protein